MDSALRFELLGPVRVWWGDVEVNIGTPQQRAVLGLLLLRPGFVVQADQLVSSIWGMNAPPAAGGMVRSYVSRLRRVLREVEPMPPIRSASGGYVLDVDSAVVDVARFERGIDAARRAHRVGDVENEAAELMAALALWQGTPLAGVRGEYADNERTRLEELQLSAIEDLAAADLDLGRHAEAASALVPIVIAQPLRERARELLMLALYRAGRKAEALKLFQETRQLLADDLGLDPGPDLQEMQRRILTSDPALMKPTRAVPSVQHAGAAAKQTRLEADDDPPAAIAPVTALPTARVRERQTEDCADSPMQLPPRLPNFIGRSGELSEALRLLEGHGPGVPVLGIAGSPGMGKTALAIEVGHHVASQFTDGVLYVDLGSTADPLGVLLRAAGHTIRPETEQEAIASWRALTSRRDYLVVLDGAKDAGQLRQLLPAGGATIVTAQRRLVERSHARWIELRPFAVAESFALLAAIIGSARLDIELTAAARLHELTSGIPEAVFVVGSRLAARPGWSLHAAVLRLSSPTYAVEPRYEDCRILHEPYEAAVRDLPPHLARALMLLALPAGPDISVRAAAAVLGVQCQEADYVLESLADAYLLEHHGEHYSFLNPVQQYARAKALEEGARAASHEAMMRLITFYAASLRNALVVIEPRTDAVATELAGERFASAEQAAGWLRRHHGHLRTTVKQASELRDAPTALLKTLFDLAQLAAEIPQRLTYEESEVVRLAL